MKATLDDKGDVLQLKGVIPVKFSDFAIEIPSYKGITVAESVKISFESKVVKAL